MADAHYKFHITMTCGGCSGAVERSLKKLDGTFCGLRPVYRSFYPPLPLPLSCSPPRPNANPPSSLGIKHYDVSLDTQTAEVTAGPELGYEAVLEKIKKTGKTVRSGEKDGVAMPV